MAITGIWKDGRAAFHDGLLAIVSVRVEASSLAELEAMAMGKPL